MFLHGYGADGNDLIEIGRAWQGLLPDTAFVSPHAPEPCGQAPVGRQWFALTFRDPDERWVGVNKAAPVLRAVPRRRAWRAASCRRRALALVGFSQGTMMALHVGAAPRRRRRRRSSAIPACSCCRTTPSPTRSPPRSSRKPPVLLVHGDQDDLIPVQALFHAAQALARARSAGRVAHVAGRRPRHRPGGPAPRRRVSGPPVRAAARRDPPLIRVHPPLEPRFTILSRSL